jgi:peptidoglycan/LPS O-acetylase OafA/YrhL
VSQLLGAFAIVLGMFLVMAGSAFLGHGSGMRAAVALLFSCAAAEFLAGTLVILAASRLAKLASETAAPGKAPGWKSRLLPAILLSVCSFFLMFALGEFLESRSLSGGMEILATVAVIAGIGGYYLLAAYFLLRRLPRSSRNVRVLPALNAVPLLAAAATLIGESNRAAVLQMLGLSLLAVACSAAGLGLADRFARLHGHQIASSPVAGSGR